MKTHHFVIIALFGGLVALSGCDQNTSGGPAATSPPSRDRLGQSDNTFSMSVPNVSLNQGQTETIAIGIKRGDNFNEDVTLSFAALPTGVTVDSGDSVIMRSDKDVKVAFAAAANASLGDFTIEVTGQPTSGAAAQSEMKLSIGELDTADRADATDDAARAKRDEDSRAIQTQWDQFKSQYAALEEKAAEATGQAKEDLDRTLAETRVKMDAAAVELEALKTASAERWEKVKEGVSNALDELKTIFE